jgi:hypothetical protein
MSARILQYTRSWYSFKIGAVRVITENDILLVKRKTQTEAMTNETKLHILLLWNKNWERAFSFIAIRPSTRKSREKSEILTEEK